MTTPGPTPGPTEPHDAEDGLRRVWVAGAVGAVVLIVVLFVAFAVVGGSGGDSGDGDGSADPHAASASSSSRSPAAAAVPSPTVSAPSPTPSLPPSPRPSEGSAPRVVWRGTLRVDGPRARRDLDRVPPRLSERDGEPDVRGDWLKTLLEAESGAQVAVVEPGTRPGAVECRDAAAAEGSDETEPLAEGDVVCVLTAAGRVARLVTTHAAQTSTAPTLTFAAVLWDVPGGGR